MTEITANIEKSSGNWLLFLAALVAAPIMGTFIGLGLAVLFFPISGQLCAAAVMLVFAPILGLKTYLLFGAPLFAAHVRFLGSKPWALAATGFVAHLASIEFLYFHAAQTGAGLRYAENVVEIGFFVAPIWGFLFGVLYRWMSHD